MSKNKPPSVCFEDYYAECRERTGSAQQVGWKSDAAQLRRFQQLARLLPVSGNFSLNDLGCGLGGFAHFLTRRTNRRVDYHGYDVLPGMVVRARQLTKDVPGVRFQRIEHARAMHEADFTVASGIFSLRGNATNQAWKDYILETIRIMHERSRRGFAFNALTSYSDPPLMRPELYYADPCELFDFCMQHCSRHVALLHDYREYDFTILVRRS